MCSFGSSKCQDLFSGERQASYCAARTPPKSNGPTLLATARASALGVAKLSSRSCSDRRTDLCKGCRRPEHFRTCPCRLETSHGDQSDHHPGGHQSHRQTILAGSVHDISFL